MPELLEQFMDEKGAGEQWVTVQELRNRFGLTRYQCNTVSGFLRRLEFGSFGQFPYVVTRIERAGTSGPSAPLKFRYLVKRKHPVVATVAELLHLNSVKVRLPADLGGSE